MFLQNQSFTHVKNFLGAKKFEQLWYKYCWSIGIRLNYYCESFELWASISMTNSTKNIWPTSVPKNDRPNRSSVGQFGIRYRIPVSTSFFSTVLRSYFGWNRRRFSCEHYHNPSNILISQWLNFRKDFLRRISSVRIFC